MTTSDSEDEPIMATAIIDFSSQNHEVRSCIQTWGRGSETRPMEHFQGIPADEYRAECVRFAAAIMHLGKRDPQEHKETWKAAADRFERMRIIEVEERSSCNRMRNIRPKARS